MPSDSWGGQTSQREGTERPALLSLLSPCLPVTLTVR